MKSDYLLRVEHVVESDIQYSRNYFKCDSQLDHHVIANLYVISLLKMF